MIKWKQDCKYSEIKSATLILVLRIYAWTIVPFYSLVWFLLYGPSTHFRSFRARSVNLAILFLGRLLGCYQYIVQILSPVNDNCSSWISERGRKAVEMFSGPILHERMCRTLGSNSEPLACQTNTLPIELPRQAFFLSDVRWSFGVIIMWAATWQNQQNECAPSEDSDQSEHPPSLIRVFAVRMKETLGH